MESSKGFFVAQLKLKAGVFVWLFLESWVKFKILSDE